MTSPLKNFDSSPFLHKKYSKHIIEVCNNKILSKTSFISSLPEILDSKSKKIELQIILKGLEGIEILEWAHLKKLRAFKFYNLKKYDKCFEILAEILSGIEEINENDEEVLIF